MIRGTTPTLEFTLPFDTGQLSCAWVTISTGSAVAIDKPLEECGCDGNVLSVKLTQEDTLKLQCDCIAEIQIRARTLGGEAIASKIIRVSVERILKDGVI